MTDMAEKIADNAYGKIIGRGAMALCALFLPFAGITVKNYLDDIRSAQSIAVSRIDEISRELSVKLDGINTTLTTGALHDQAIDGRVSTIEAERAKLLPFRYSTTDAERDFRLRDLKDSYQDQRLDKHDQRLDGIDNRLTRQGFNTIKPEVPR